MRPDSESLRSRDPQRTSSSPPRMYTDVKMSTVNRTSWCAWERKPYIAPRLLTVSGWDLWNRQCMAKRQDYSLTQCNPMSHNALGQRSLPPNTFTGNLQRRVKASFMFSGGRDMHLLSYMNTHTCREKNQHAHISRVTCFPRVLKYLSRKGITWHEWWFNLWTVSMTSS